MLSACFCLLVASFIWCSLETGAESEELCWVFIVVFVILNEPSVNGNTAIMHNNLTLLATSQFLIPKLLG